MTRNDHDAEDLTQEAYLRALEFFDGFRGGNARAWLLKIVRNTCYTWLRHYRAQELSDSFDDEVHSGETAVPNPETLLLENADRELLQHALEQLPAEFREAVVMRELEGLSYKEIADIAGVPLGTVMSRLARARDRLKQFLARQMRKES